MNWISKYIWGGIVAIFTILSGYTMYKKRQVDKLELEKEELEEAIIQNDYNHHVDTANKLNEKIEVKEELKNENIFKPYNPSDL